MHPNGLFTLPDSDSNSDSDSKPNGYIVLCRSFHIGSDLIGGSKGWGHQGRSPLPRIQILSFSAKKMKNNSTFGSWRTPSGKSWIRHWIWIWIPMRMVSQMVTVPILGTDLYPRDRFPSKFYYISIRGSKSESEPMGNFCILSTVIAMEISHQGNLESLAFSSVKYAFSHFFILKFNLHFS